MSCVTTSSLRSGVHICWRIESAIGMVGDWWFGSVAALFHCSQLYAEEQ